MTPSKALQTDRPTSASLRQAGCQAWASWGAN